LFFYGQNKTSESYEICQFTSASGSGFVRFGADFWNTSLQPTNSYDITKWYNVCMTYDGTVAKLYVNDTQIGTITIALNTNITVGECTSYIGAHPSYVNQANMFTKMNYIYNRALSSAEVIANFNNTKARCGY
jgi:hypothetical protein